MVAVSVYIPTNSARGFPFLHILSSIYCRFFDNGHSDRYISSVQFSCSVMSDSLRPHEPQHTRPPWPSPTPGVHPNPCPLSWWCHPAITSSVIPFSSCPQSFPASGSFQMSQLFASGGQSIGVSASTSVLPMNTQDWCPLGWTGWISLQSKGLSQFKSIRYIMTPHVVLGRRQWHPTPVLLPQKFHGQRSLVGCSPWGC